MSIKDYENFAKRREDETYEQYHVRRTEEQKTLKACLLGKVYKSVSPSTRAEKRQAASRPKHWGNRSKYTKARTK